MPNTSFPFTDLSWISELTHCSFPCSKTNKKETFYVFVYIIQYHQKHATSSLPTLGCYITASWDNQIKFLKEPSFYKSRHHDKPASTPTQHYTHTNTHASAFVSFMMQTKAEITESSGSVEEHALQR